MSTYPSFYVSMKLAFFLIFCLLTIFSSSDACMELDTVDISLREIYCDQPVFFTLLPKTEETQLLDNVCLTYYPLPDDPYTFQGYRAEVFCDGSTSITSFIITELSKGVFRRANVLSTVTQQVFGYAGCDTYLLYECTDFGKECGLSIAGGSYNCRSIGLSCLRRVEEILEEQGLPDTDFYVLPMKLPNRCVTQQLCVQPPNPFYDQLHSVKLNL